MSEEGGTARQGFRTGRGTRADAARPPSGRPDLWRTPPRPTHSCEIAHSVLTASRTLRTPSTLTAHRKGRIAAEHRSRDNPHRAATATRHRGASSWPGHAPRSRSAELLSSIVSSIAFPGPSRCPSPASTRPGRPVMLPAPATPCSAPSRDSSTSSPSPDGRRLASLSLNNTVRLWDVGTGVCLQVLDGHADAVADAAGPQLLSWRAVRKDSELVIKPQDSSTPVAWFPANLRVIVTHPSGRFWAGAVDRHGFLITLEGTPSASS